MSEFLPIPEGFTTVTPHLQIKGAKKAIAFYEKAFNAKLISQIPAEDGERLLHAAIQIGTAIVFLCDEFPEFCGVSIPVEQPRGVTLHLYVENVDTAFEQALQAGAVQTMAPDNMFWGDRYGRLKDPFGIEWSIATPVVAEVTTQCSLAASTMKA